MMGDKAGKLLIRGIDSEVLKQLELMAKESERSLEAEARFALRSWARPAFSAIEQSLRRKDISARLNEALDNINEIRHANKLRPSHIAIKIGSAYAESVENWFLGQEEPSFAELEKVAMVLGVNSSWLAHGDDTPFPTGYVRLSEDPTIAARWLLDFSPAAEPAIAQPLDPSNKHEKLVFVRSDDATGSLAIIKVIGEHHCTTFKTPTHVSNSIGAGGAAQLRALFLTLELLYKVFTRDGITIKSMIIPKEEFYDLISGKIHPLSLTPQERYERPWWEDIWDEKESGKHNYWDEWISITNRIHKEIDLSERSKELRAQIRSGKYPGIKELRDYQESKDSQSNQ
ncbi:MULTISPECIES: helix-turn-helix domain-containing protein [Alcaligenes]|uniref:XRE family transcriptional regulator n=2 Tax=Alcaligenes TaxID=507 RepID=A0A3G2HY68_9BURK|nr:MULTISPECIES: helix-turn-helix transcriptional regulator [Alcaligenes]AYN22003.1 XRE family transcriptional regulator [Alcaligenes aquatilis]MCX5566511.1 helix-turn-helix transcriptional regulator [Alcaligenes phenolicus]